MTRRVFTIEINGMTPPPELVHFKMTFGVSASDAMKAAVIAGALTFKKIGQFMAHSVSVVGEPPVEEVPAPLHLLEESDDQDG